MQKENSWFNIINKGRFHNLKLGKPRVHQDLMDSRSLLGRTIQHARNQRVTFR